MAQGAQFLYGASTEITNDHGEQIDKQYLISKIKSVGASVKEIQEGFQSLDDGLVAPDDPGAAKLIADQNKLSDVIDDVSGKFPESVAKVKAAFDYYVRTVIDRNTQILTYNSIVIEMVKTSADLVHAQQRIQDLNDASLTASEANWPDVTAYVSCLYYKAREFILKEFDNAARAYQFWAINDEDILGPASERHRRSITMRSITASSLCAKSTWTPWRTSAPIPIRSIASCCHSPPSRFRRSRCAVA